MPVFHGIKEFASLCHISYKKISAVQYNSHPFYRRFTIKKKSGKERIIYEPNSTVKAIQVWILRHILDKVNPSDYATAYRKGYSILSNTNPHKNNRFFFCTDIMDFFPSIKMVRVFYLFRNIGYDERQAELLARLCTCNNSLPQGGVTSPAISNLVVNKLDRRLAGLANKKNIVYTRYADDLTFSSNNRSILNNSSKLIEEIIENEGFKINSMKTQLIGPKRSCKITGLIKNTSKPTFGIGKRKKNWMRCVLFNLVVNYRIIDDNYLNEESVLGWINYLKQVDPVSYDYMINYWNKLKTV